MISAVRPDDIEYIRHHDQDNLGDFLIGIINSLVSVNYKDGESKFKWQDIQDIVELYYPDVFSSGFEIMSQTARVKYAYESAGWLFTEELPLPEDQKNGRDIYIVFKRGYTK